MTTASAPSMTPEDLLALPDLGRYEALICGELKERNVSVESSHVAFRFNGALAAYLNESGIGWGFQSDAGLQIFPWAPSQVRFADGGFYRRDRGPRPGRGHLRVAPDLVIEVVSPGDDPEDIELKMDDYLRAGVRMVWLAHPSTRHIYVFRQSQQMLRLGPEDILTGEDILPGFSVRVAALFPEPEPDAPVNAGPAEL